MVRNSLSLGALLLTFSTLASAGSINQIVAFGDSLTDDGNALIIYQNPAIFGPYPAGAPVPLPPNYTTGRFTDGPDTTPASAFPGKVWLEDLSSQLGLPTPTASLAGGTDYAIGSAQTGTANPQDMGNQVALYLTAVGGHASPTALYAFWGGANDLLDHQGAATAQAAATNIFDEIETIAAAGGRNFLWLNLPPLGALTGNPTDTVDAVLFNQFMQADLGTLEALFPTDTFTSVDVFSFFEDGADGLNLNCIGDQVANPDNCAIWDGLHPTNVAHNDIATLAHQALVPEPSLWWVSGISLAGFVALRRRSVTPL